jgi:hypothetical protein
MLDQYEDTVPEGDPTRTFIRDKAPPSLDGLYERFTPDHVLARLKQLMILGVNSDTLLSDL